MAYNFIRCHIKMATAAQETAMTNMPAGTKRSLTNAYARLIQLTSERQQHPCRTTTIGPTLTLPAPPATALPSIRFQQPPRTCWL